MNKKEKKPKNRKKRLIIFFGILAFFLIWWAWSWIPVTEYMSFDFLEGDDKKIRMALITDLHSCYYGKDMDSLYKRIDKEEPDLIMISGDFFDDVKDDDNGKILIDRLAKKYPCYYVSGNHEQWSGRLDEQKDYLRSVGVRVLEGECETVTVNGAMIDICGVDDPSNLVGIGWSAELKNAYAMTKEDHIKILLSHRPERVEDYEKYDFDLILTGHAHAGQILVPFINRGLYAPNQGVFSKYVNGQYKLESGSIMVVSRGLSRENVPAPRFFNHPEVIIIDIT